MRLTNQKQVSQKAPLQNQRVLHRASITDVLLLIHQNLDNLALLVRDLEVFLRLNVSKEEMMRHHRRDQADGLREEVLISMTVFPALNNLVLLHRLSEIEVNVL